jgi:hypothetical protein
MMNSFEIFNKLLEKEKEEFYRYDEISFPYKFLMRFGASTLSVTLATAIVYPLDTLKRRCQVDGALGYKHTNLRPNDISLGRFIYNTDGPKAFYHGFSMCLARNIPTAFL